MTATPLTINLSNRLPRSLITHIHAKFQRYCTISSSSNSDTPLVLLQKNMLEDILIPEMSLTIFLNPERELLQSLRDNRSTEQSAHIYALVEFQERHVLELRRYVMESLKSRTSKVIQIVPYFSSEGLQNVVVQLLMCTQRFQKLREFTLQDDECTHDERLEALLTQNSQHYLSIVQFLQQRGWNLRMFAQFLRDRDPLLLHDLGEDVFWDLHAHWFGGEEELDVSMEDVGSGLQEQTAQS